MLSLRRYIFFLLIGVSLACWGKQKRGASAVYDTDSLSLKTGTSASPEGHLVVKDDSIMTMHVHRSLFHRIGHGLSLFFREFNNYDHSYIEPQHYNFTVMMQNTNSYEGYTLTTATGKRVSLAPEASYRLGPYVGWQWVFFGYTIDLAHISVSKNDQNRKELDLSIYSNMLGIDLYWKKTGNNYKIRSLNLGDHLDTSPMDNEDFGGFNSSIRSVNIYYIFNHHYFSYPAAYSQSTVQKKSVGSMLLGLGYMNHEINMDWGKLDQMVQSRLGSNVELGLDSTQFVGSVHYTDWNISGGYSYNWVFAKNWLLNASLSLAMAYNYTKGDEKHNHFTFRDFSIHNFNLDGIGRFGIVWNNTRWYAGSSAIFHSYNYKKNRFSATNYFGSLNFYVGFNFG